MRRVSTLAFLAFAALAATSVAAPAPASGTTVNLDGSADARINRNMSDSASPPHGPNAANAAANSATSGQNAKAQADADLAARQAGGSERRLKVEKQDLQGKAAGRELQKKQSPANYDHSISMGDKDHTQQVTNVKIYFQKEPK